MWDFNVSLFVMSADKPSEVHPLTGLSVEAKESPAEKAKDLIDTVVTSVSQKSQILNPDAALTFSAPSNLSLLNRYAYAPNGSHGGDSSRHRWPFWNSAALITNGDHSRERSEKPRCLLAESIFSRGFAMEKTILKTQVRGFKVKMFFASKALSSA